MYRSYVCNYTSNTYRTVSIIVFDIMSRIELIKQSKKTERLFNDPVKKKKLNYRIGNWLGEEVSSLNSYGEIFWVSTYWFDELDEISGLKISWESLPNYLTHFLVYILYSIRNVLGNRFQIQIFHESPYFYRWENEPEDSMTIWIVQEHISWI